MAKASSQMYLPLGRFANSRPLKASFWRCNYREQRLPKQVKLELCEAPEALIYKPKVSICQRGQAIG